MAERSADELLREAVARHTRGAFDDAARLYRKVLARRPGDANALNLLGVLARQKGDVARALELAGQAVAARPDSPIFLANLGAALADAGRFSEAVDAMRLALSRRPDDAQTLRNLGQALSAMGNASAALAPLRQAVRLAPDAPEPWLALAHALREAGDRDAAAAARRVLALPGVAPHFREQARFLLAALGEGDVPDRAPAPYVRELFDQYAGRFDEDLEHRLGYRTPGRLAALIEECGVVPEASRRVLDLGCGTGLSGVALRPFASLLVGLDLSPRMLAMARARNVYDELHEGDLLDWLPKHPARFDLIAAADVLNYLGDLGPVLRLLAGASVPGGDVAFSVEAGEGRPFALGGGMRYRHDPSYVSKIAADAGFDEIARRDEILRQEHGEPVRGYVFLLRRPR